MEVKYVASNIIYQSPRLTIYSVGIIIWACVSNSIPFNYQDENAETNIKAVRKAIAENKMPWSSVPHNLIPRKILQLVASCCNPRPKLRPSATEVASALWDVMILPPLEMSLATSAEEETKARVSDILDQGRKSALFISQEDEQVLRSLEAQQDPVASYLLGLAIWFKHIKPESEVEEFLMLPNVEPGLGKVPCVILEHNMIL